MFEHAFQRNFDAQMPDAPNATSAQGRQRGRAIPQFTETYYHDEDATAQTGRVVMRPRVTCEIHIPGDHLQTATHYVDPDNPHDLIIQRFPEEWERFNRTRANENDPTKWRLDNWPMLNPAQVAMLKMKHVYYVEDLAELTDQQVMDTIGIGGQKLREHAKAAVQTAQLGAAPAQLVEKVDALTEAVKDKDKIIDELRNRLEGLLRQPQQAAAQQPMIDPSVALLQQQAAAQPQQLPETAQPPVDVPSVPRNFRTMSLPKLKNLCIELGITAPVSSQAEAIEFIEEWKKAN